MPRLSKIGAAALAAFGWTGGQTVSVDFLVVAGGGGAGSHGGGGAGGFLTGTTSLNPTQSYTVTVGAGGAGIASGASGGSNGSNGSNSQFGTLTASVGGGAGGGYVANNAGSTGGSGGGGGYSDPIGSALGGAGTSGQGNAGGSGFIGGAGGGGANAAGSNGGGSGSAGVGGAGGNGTASSISGSSVTYAGGGGGGNGDARTGGSGGAGGTGGGGAGSTGTLTTGAAGTANLGGGGGGGGSGSGTNYGGGGQGGSGVVIISYVGAQQFGGGVVTSSGGSTIHTFNTSGTLSPLSSLTASYLIVAGGGGGGAYAYPGGGGAGGFLSGSGLTLDTNSIYLVTVGAGGVKGDVSGNTNGGNGSNSIFSGFATSAVGGGGGSQSTTSGGSGGSGGGGRGNASGNTGGTATSGQGNNGGNGASDGATYANGGGGGGAGAVGANATSGAGGNGGNGSASSISGSSVTYAGGGGGGGTGTEGTGGTGGGGNASEGGGTAGGTNTGGGGGSAGGITVADGSAGGSGVVIISYAGATQSMAGGTVTVAGGNVIHTFTSSGYLTPIVLVTNSLRFRSSASAYLNRTFPTAGDTQKFTQSIWTKRGTLGVAQWFGVTVSGNASYGMYFDTNDSLYSFIYYTGSVWQGQLYTTQLFRDPAAWYHIVLAVDTTQAVASNRVKVYVNGVQVTSFSTENYPNQNQTLNFNSAAAHFVNQLSSGSYYDGYIAELNWIDGQQLTPNSFGTSNGLGVWQPIRYGGSYGTNGFYLKFTDTTSTATLGTDFSPNGNTWTVNNISLTSGSTYDSMTDVPTLTSATTANYAVFNPLEKGANVTISDGNLKYSSNSASGVNGYISMYITTGMKSYFEFTCGSAATYRNVDIGGMVYAGDTGLISGGTGGTGTFATWTTGDVVRFACDYNAGTIACYKNATLQTTVTGVTNTSSWVIIPAQSTNLGEFTANFGQQPFAYSIPSGFAGLNTFNLPTPTIGATASTTANKYFDATVYTGTNANLSIVNSGSMQPDFVWIKNRGPSARAHNLVDSVRGSHQVLFSNDTAAEATSTITTGVLSFASNGFNLGLDTSTAGSTNASGESHVGWQWRASNATAVTNTSGSITSSVSASTTAGFSIVTFTAPSSGQFTVGHGLGVTPNMVIVKNRTTGSTTWFVYHSSLGVNNTDYLVLNTIAAEASFSTMWGASGMTSSTCGFTVGGATYANDNHVAYCFAQVAGYSAFGSYTGNGSSDGPFIFTGFRPRWIMIKSTVEVSNWLVWDTSRSPFNAEILLLYPSLSNAEGSDSTYGVDGVSNGFKIRGTGQFGGLNNSGNSYIYACYAENPLKYANAR